MDRTTQFSPCRKYRYALWREWAKHVGDLKTIPFDGELKPPGHSDWSPSPYLMIVGLNPSTADETLDDPTIRRCVGFAKAWGFGALCMANLFAWRDTKPENMKKAADAAGPECGKWLCEIAEGAGMILAAWGKHGSFMGRDRTVLGALTALGKPIHCLGTNSDGSPKHPLYIASKTMPTIYKP